MQTTAPERAAPTAALSVDAKLGVTFPVLLAALTAWATAFREGKTKSHDESDACPVEQTAAESASYLWDTLATSGARPVTPTPAIGEYWAGQGGVYAGQVREDDDVTYHVILAATKPDGDVTHAASLDWAKTVSVEGHRDFEIPSRRTSALLYANLPEQFEKRWHWTSTQYSRNGAWCQTFGGGDQLLNYKSAGLRARAVRRFIP